MPTSYPGGLDNFLNPSGTDVTNSTTVPHSAQHANANDAIEAIQAALGVNPARGVANISERFQALEGSVVAEAENLLKSAVWYIDAAHPSAGSQTITNLGWGGSTLNAVAGTGTGVDGSDPKFLPWTGENYVYLPGVASNYLSVPDEAALDITSAGFHIIARVAADDWTPASRQRLAAKYVGTTQRSWAFSLETTGALRLTLSSDGAAIVNGTSSASVVASDGSALWVAATWDRTSGDVKFYTAADSVSVPSSWTQLGTTQTAVLVADLFSSTSPVEIGSYANGTEPFSGLVYRAIVKNGIDGPSVLDIDCSVLSSGSATSFSARTGQTVSIIRSSSGRKAVAVTQPCWLFGTDDYITVADNDLLDFGAADSFTAFAAYRYWNTGLSGASINKMGLWADANAGWSLGHPTTTNSLGVFVGDGTSRSNTGASTRTPSQLCVTVGTRSSATKTIAVYLNGVLGSEVSDTTSGNFANSQPLRVGLWTSHNYGDMEGIAFAVFRKALTQYEIELLNDYFQSRDSGSDAYQPRKYVNMDAVPVGAKGDMAFNEQSQQLLVKQGDSWNGVLTEGSILRAIPAGPSPAESLLKQAVWWIDANHNSASGQRIRNLGWGGTTLDATAGSSGASDSSDPMFLDFDGVPYVYLPGVLGCHLSVPDADSLDITGDIDIRVLVSMDNWNPSVTSPLLSKVGLTGNRSYRLYVNSGGTLQFQWWADGSNALGSASTAVLPAASGSSMWVRATLDVDNGAGTPQYEVKYYTSTDGIAWTQLGSTITGTTGVTSIYASTRAVEIGANLDFVTSQQLTGKVYRAQVLNGINGTPVLDIDTSVLTSGSQTSFTALTGQTVTINRATSGRKSVAVVAPVWLFGTDDYMEVPDNDLLDFGASDSFTVLAVVRQWINADNDMIVAKRDDIAAAGTERGWFLGSLAVSSGFNRQLVAIADGTNVASPGSTTFGWTSGTMHVRVLQVNRSTQTVTSNIVNVGSITASTSAVGSLSNSLPLRIGRESIGTSRYADMEFIAAAVFRRELTQDEILTLTSYYQGR